MHLELDRVPQGEEPRRSKMELWVTVEEANWFTAARDAMELALYRATVNNKEDFPPEEDVAHLCLRAGMVAMFGLTGEIPKDILHIMIKRELVPFYDEDNEGAP